MKMVNISGLLTGCSQKWGIVRHYEGQLSCKKKPIVRQSIANFKYFGGMLNGVLIGILVYLSNGINIIS